MVTCSSGKKSYLTHSAARRKARFQMRTARRLILTVYRCEECKTWHLTSKPQKEPHKVTIYRERRDQDPPSRY